MSNCDGPPIQDVYSPSGDDIQTWAHSGRLAEQDWDIFMAEPEHLPLLVSLIEDPSCLARDTLLLSLYCTIGHTDHTDPRIAAAIDAAESCTDPWVTTWARRVRHVLDHPDDFDDADWCGLESFAARRVEIDEAIAHGAAEGLIASWAAPSDDGSFVSREAE